MKNFLERLQARATISKAAYTVALSAGDNWFMAALVYIGAMISG